MLACRHATSCFACQPLIQKSKWLYKEGVCGTGLQQNFKTLKVWNKYKIISQYFSVKLLEFTHFKSTINKGENKIKSLLLLLFLFLLYCLIINKFQIMQCKEVKKERQADLPSLTWDPARVSSLRKSQTEQSVWNPSRCLLLPVCLPFFYSWLLYA